MTISDALSIINLWAAGALLVDTQREVAMLRELEDAADWEAARAER